VTNNQWLEAPLLSRFKARDLDSRTQKRQENTFGVHGRRAARHPTLTQRIPLASLETEHTPAKPMTMTVARRRRRLR
jgi:hypothetical protein